MLKVVLILGIILCHIYGFSQINKEVVIEQFNLPQDYNILSFCKDENIDSMLTGVICDTIYKNDTIIAYAEYKNGKKIKILTYYMSGEREREEFYDWDNDFGRGTHWFKSGKKECEDFFNKCLDIWTHIEWYENGSFSGFLNKDVNKNTGIQKWWRDDGTISSEAFYIDTTEKAFINKVYHLNGILWQEWIFSLGKQSYKEFYSDGKKAALGYIMDAPLFLLGHWQEWYNNGNLKREYFYNDSIPNQKEGIWKWWDEKGNLIKEEFYKNGELIDTKEYIKSKKID